MISDHGGAGSACFPDSPVVSFLQTESNQYETFQMKYFKMENEKDSEVRQFQCFPPVNTVH